MPGRRPRWSALLRSFDARVTLTNLDTGRGPVDAGSLSAVATLDARRATGCGSRPPGRRRTRRCGDRAAGRRAFDDPPAPTGHRERAGRSPGSGLDLAIGPALVRRARWTLRATSPATPRPRPRARARRWRRCGRRLEELERRTTETSGEDAGAIFAAQTALLDDPDVTELVDQDLATGCSAVEAWRRRLDAVAAGFEALADPYQRERAADVRSVQGAVLRALVGETEPDDAEDAAGPAIPSSWSSTSWMRRQRRPSTSSGSPGSPSVARGDDRARRHRGVVPRNPAGHRGRQGRRRRRATGSWSPSTRGVQFWPTRRTRTSAAGPRTSPNGRRERVEPRRRRPRAGGHVRRADGCRCSRTSGRWPTPSRPLRTGPTGRGWCGPRCCSGTADHAAVGRGADPGLPGTRRGAGRQAADDPDLGHRRRQATALPAAGAGRRTRSSACAGCGRSARTVRTPATPAAADQLAAICRAARETAVRVMFPMVTNAAEVRRARPRCERGRRRAIRDGLEVGIMIEVPAAALAVDRSPTGLDFVSIGTNDLTQYTTAADRGNDAVADLADPLDPGRAAADRPGVPQRPDGRRGGGLRRPGQPPGGGRRCCSGSASTS